MLGYIPGLIHSWYIIAKYPDIEYVVFDEEQRIQSTYPPTTAYMAQQQHQQQPQPQQQPYFPPQHRGTYFDHPEPFKTSGQQHHTNVLDGPLSPLSRDPMTAPPSSNSNTGSSSGNNNSNYGSIMGASASGNADDGDDEQQPVEAPPSYENVMNETSKQFR
ncbi:unnamed protein product [[Candida] boidinii]|uniref:Unnamed protein product n=1 Tax=Candida boidinii TaxID=5477 RepID=A0A9W6SZE4_CANBO|nr:unnamed protein product [[Candida] boidinii]GMF63482.1 unnamed protein product [[Candida] boidinii]GMG03587.1 unnamed protein product [[Candida] boidinii]